MKLKQAARQALEALENAPIEYDFHGNHMDVEFGQQLDKAITALREALEEQAELCPLCGDGKLYEHTMYRCKGCGSELADARLMDKNKALAEQVEQEPVAEWEKLKDPQTLFVNLNRGFPAQLTYDHLLHLLNKTEQAEQEPVAYMFKVKRTLPSSTPLDVFAAIEYHPLPHEDIISKEPLYAAPVRTKDLTDDEIREALYWVEVEAEELVFARAVIAADREKNK